MGYGQYSAGGGLNRTKAEMLDIFERHNIDEKTARKGGKNRLHYKTATGEEHFTLHETVVATLNADRTRLTLADGGWHTPTTKTAWSDAIKAFKLKGKPTFYVSKWGDIEHEGEKGYWTSYRDMPDKSERAVSYVVTDGVIMGRDAEAKQDLPMIRASLDYGNFAVRYDGKQIISEAGTTLRATPFKVLVTLYRIDKLARSMTSYHCMRNDVLDAVGFEAFGYSIHCGQNARMIMVGCHTFKTAEIRATRLMIERLYPDAIKAAKKFIKKNPTDFGKAAWEAERSRAYKAHGGQFSEGHMVY